LDAAQRLLWGGVLVGCAALAGKFWRSGLYKVYPFFFSYLLYRLIRGLVLYAIPANRRTLYGWFYFSSAPLGWLALILIVLELYTLVLRHFPGIASLSRWLLTAGLVTSIAVSGMSLRLDLSNPGERFPVVLFFTVIQRGLMTSLAIFLLVITGFLTWYPVPLSRNVIVQSMVCAVYFLSNTMALLVRNVAGDQISTSVNLALPAIELGCVMAWAALMTQAGEAKKVVLRHHWRPEQQQRLMEQLAAINATLLRTARRTE
jgi:hypothetical protein